MKTRKAVENSHKLSRGFQQAAESAELQTVYLLQFLNQKSKNQNLYCIEFIITKSLKHEKDSTFGQITIVLLNLLTSSGSSSGDTGPPFRKSYRYILFRTVTLLNLLIVLKRTGIKSTVNDALFFCISFIDGSRSFFFN